MMKWVNILTLISFGLFFSCCEEENEPAPPVIGTLTISNLIYNPTEIPIEPDRATFTISGTFNFVNAEGGPAKLRFTSSSGADVTADILENTGQTSGIITGYMEFEMVSEPGSYTFDIWLIDAKGRPSNKLSGTVEVIHDDRMIYWKKVTLPNPNWRMNKVIWVNNNFIAVGNDGVILTSPNGIEWTKQPSVTNIKLNAITWTGTQYVTVGDNNIILTSPDGSVWTERNVIDSIQHLHGISWSGQQFVAVGRNLDKDKSLIMTSPDGITWAKNSFEMEGVELKNVAWSGNLFMAVGDYVYDPCCRTPDCICGFWPTMITSPDGISWSDRSPIGSNLSHMIDILWDGSRFLIPSGFYIVNTVDGTTWNYTDNTYIYLKKITSKDDDYVGVGPGAGYNVDLIYHSDDGMKWTDAGPTVVQLNIPPNTLTDIAWSGQKYVVSGLTGYMYVSPY